MNFILEDIDRENYVITEYMESIRRAKALVDNKQIILKLFGDTEEKLGVEYNIHCYTDEYPDEFFITRLSHANNMEQTAHIEILTDKQAESNEKEEIAGGCVIGVDSTDGYKLGETVQTYQQIGNTKYWYREM